MMQKLIISILTIAVLFLTGACTEKETPARKNVEITISVKDVITVNSDTVAIDSLDAKLAELGVTGNTNVRIVPDPEAGAATIERVQRKVRNYQYSAE